MDKIKEKIRHKSQQGLTIVIFKRVWYAGKERSEKSSPVSDDLSDDPLDDICTGCAAISWAGEPNLTVSLTYTNPPVGGSANAYCYNEVEDGCINTLVVRVDADTSFWDLEEQLHRSTAIKVGQPQNRFRREVDMYFQPKERFRRTSQGEGRVKEADWDDVKSQLLSRKGNLSVKVVDTIKPRTLAERDSGVEFDGSGRLRANRCWQPRRVSSTTEEDGGEPLDDPSRLVREFEVTEQNWEMVKLGLLIQTGHLMCGAPEKVNKTHTRPPHQLRAKRTASVTWSEAEDSWIM